MRFAIFTTMSGTDSEDTPVKLLDNLREQVILAEELGFESVWLGEHHFRPYGLGDMPNPIVVGADLAARTTRIRIGQMSNIAPWWHPIRLAERPRPCLAQRSAAPVHSCQPVSVQRASITGHSGTVPPLHLSEISTRVCSRRTKSAIFVRTLEICSTVRSWISPQV